MNTYTLLSRSLLLVVFLAVSWAVAVPLNTLSGNKHFTEDPEVFLAQHPSIARQLYPHLLNAASDVTLFLDRDVVLDVLRNYMAGQRVEEAQPHTEEEHTRSKRDTTLSGAVHRQVNPFGHSTTASGTVGQPLDDNHSVRGTVGVTRNTIPGLGNFNIYNAGVNFDSSLNDDTTFTVGANRDWYPDGSTRTGAIAALENTWDNNRHSVSANVHANRHDSPGRPSYDSQSAGLNYDFNIDKDTTLRVTAQRASSPFGSENFGGLNFIHRGLW